MILVFQLNKEYMIGLTQEPNDDGRRDRVKFRDAIASKNWGTWHMGNIFWRENPCSPFWGTFMLEGKHTVIMVPQNGEL